MHILRWCRFQRNSLVVLHIHFLSCYRHILRLEYAICGLVNRICANELQFITKKVFLYHSQLPIDYYHNSASSLCDMDIVSLFLILTRYAARLVKLGLHRVKELKQIGLLMFLYWQTKDKREKNGNKSNIEYDHVFVRIFTHAFFFFSLERNRIYNNYNGIVETALEKKVWFYAITKKKLRLLFNVTCVISSCFHTLLLDIVNYRGKDQYFVSEFRWSYMHFYFGL